MDSARFRTWAFLVSSEEARFLYKCDALYDRGSEMSIRWNDPDLKIDWGLQHPLLSEKDAAAPYLRDVMGNIFLATKLDPMLTLVTGASGQVGLALAREVAPIGKLCLTNRQDLDLSAPHSIPERLDEIRPGLIINAAAYTAVDKAGSEPAIAYVVNGRPSASWVNGPREKTCL